MAKIVKAEKKLNGFSRYPLFQDTNGKFGFINEAAEVEQEGFETEVEAAYRLGRYCAILDYPQGFSSKDFDLLRKVERLQKQNGELLEQLQSAGKELKEYKAGFAIIEQALRDANKNKLDAAPFPLTGEVAFYYVEALKSAYRHCLEMCNVKEVKEVKEVKITDFSVESRIATVLEQ